MISPLQSARIFLLVLFLIALVSADDAQASVALGDFAADNVGDAIAARQASSTTPDSSAATATPTAAAGTTTPGAATTAPSAVTSSPTPSPTPTSTPTTEPATTPSTSTPTTAPTSVSHTASNSPATSDTPTSTPTSASPTAAKTITTRPVVTTTAPTSNKVLSTTLTQQYTTVVVTTIGDQVISSTSVGTSLIPTQTAEAINTNPNTSNGMSQQTKTTVIGVVCGVGGAIFLALVFLVFWKFWGRRRAARKEAQEDDGLMMTSPGEKDGSSAANPFQSTLESYHAPQHPVNASSNF